MGWQRPLVTLLVVGLTVTQPTRSTRADGFDDAGKTIARITGLRGLVRDLSDSAVGPAAEKVRGLLRDVDGLLTRADSIVYQRIEQGYKRAQEILDKAEAAVHSIIDHQLHAAEAIIAQARAFVADLDQRISEHLCKIAPNNRGVEIVALPFVGTSPEAVVQHPMRSKCWSKVPGITGNPDEYTVRDWWYFDGLLCEWQAVADRMPPDSGGSLERLARIYDEMSLIAKRATCYVPDAAREDLVLRQAEYVRRSRVLRQSKP